MKKLFFPTRGSKEKKATYLYPRYFQNRRRYSDIVKERSKKKLCNAFAKNKKKNKNVFEFRAKKKTKNLRYVHFVINRIIQYLSRIMRFKKK